MNICYNSLLYILYYLLQVWHGTGIYCLLFAVITHKKNKSKCKICDSIFKDKEVAFHKGFIFLLIASRIF